MKAVVAAFNQEIVQPVVEPMEYYTALVVITGGAARCPVMNIITPWGDILINITAAFGPSPPPITTRSNSEWEWAEYKM